MGTVTNGAGAVTGMGTATNGVGAVNNGAGAVTGVGTATNGVGAVNNGAGALTGAGVGNDFSSLALGVTSTTLDALFNSLFSLAIILFCDGHMFALFHEFIVTKFNQTINVHLLRQLQLCFHHLLVFKLLILWALFEGKFVLRLG